MVIDLGESDAPSHFVKDIEDGSGAWRWTGQHPTLKTLVFNKEHLNLSADFTLWDAALKQTGPLQISFFVNDHLLGQARYAEAGYQHFEKPVPEDLIILDAENSVAMSVDKMYTAPEDGKKFGIILTRIGFEQK